MNNKISFIILSWNSENYLEKCFDSIISKCNGEEIDFEIIDVDNNSTDTSRNILDQYRKKYPNQFRQVLLSDNFGTTYPRNVAMKLAEGDYICIIDSDTELISGSLSSVLRVLDGNDKIGLIAPKLIFPTGVVQNSVKKFPTFMFKLMKIPKAVFNLNTSNYDFYDNFPFDEETVVDTAISACWFFRKNLIEKVGYLDENIFYSPEDLDYCIRIWKSGMNVLYFPDITVLHDTQQISHRKPFSKVSLSHFKGLCYYYRKHGGWITTNNLYKRINRQWNRK